MLYTSVHVLKTTGLYFKWANVWPVTYTPVTLWYKKESKQLPLLPATCPLAPFTCHRPGTGSSSQMREEGSSPGGILSKELAEPSYKEGKN